jgi:hypothetical protein
MPLQIPAFSQYNAPMPPLRGLWNRPPAEGEYFVSAEIDWLSSPPSTAVQFSLSGNSPVALSQIVALICDNGRSGSDVSFVFPDTGFELVVAARNQGVFPVFTNALMFYAVSLNAILGDVTVLQIANSMPPPIPIVATSAQNHASVAGILLNVNGTTQIVPATVSGTLNSLSVMITASSGTSAGSAALTLVDGSSKIIWQTEVSLAPSLTQTIPINLAGLSLRFTGGLSLNVGNTSLTGQYVVVNAYYSTP